MSTMSPLGSRIGSVKVPAWSIPSDQGVSPSRLSLIRYVRPRDRRCRFRMLDVRVPVIRGGGIAIAGSRRSRARLAGVLRRSAWRFFGVVRALATDGHVRSRPQRKVRVHLPQLLVPALQVPPARRAPELPQADRPEVLTAPDYGAVSPALLALGPGAPDLDGRHVLDGLVA